MHNLKAVQGVGAVYMKVRAAIFLAGAVCAALFSTATWARQPEPIKPENWVTMADNLPEADRLVLEGEVSVELSVSKTGTVTGCRVVKSSGHSLLDDHTCQILSSRARFKPATDEKGNPTPGTFAHSMRWQTITIANWASDGYVRAEMIVDSVRNQGTECAAEIKGQISEHMKQMACFVLVNQVRNISAARTEKRDVPFRAAFVLEVHPDANGASTKEGLKQNEQRFAYARAVVSVNPMGLRSDCRMIETNGPSAAIFPICGPTPSFRYAPSKNAADANTATVFRQEVSYYVLDL